MERKPAKGKRGYQRGTHHCDALPALINTSRKFLAFQWRFATFEKKYCNEKIELDM